MLAGAQQQQHEDEKNCQGEQSSSRIYWFLLCNFSRHERRPLSLSFSLLSLNTTWSPCDQIVASCSLICSAGHASFQVDGVSWELGRGPVRPGNIEGRLLRASRELSYNARVYPWPAAGPKLDWRRLWEPEPGLRTRQPATTRKCLEPLGAARRRRYAMRADGVGGQRRTRQRLAENSRAAMRRTRRNRA